MQAYDTQHLPTDLRNWINARLLKPLLYFEGGWEKWWQSDFPAWLDTVNDTQFDFRREVRDGGIIIDWVVNGNSDSPTNAIELKAQTHKTTKSSFVNQVGKDLDALRELSPFDYPVRMSLIAVIDQTTFDAMVERDFVPLTKTSQVAFLSRTL